MELTILRCIFHYFLSTNYWFIMDLAKERKLEPEYFNQIRFRIYLLGLGYYLLFATKFFTNLQGITSLNIFTIALLVITLVNYAYRQLVCLL